MKVVPLHTRPDLIHQCCEFLNKEWPRSKTARMLNLQKSCDRLPCSLLLIEENGDETKVIAHSRLTPITTEKNASMLESVVVDPEKRGRGYGKLIIQYTEERAKQLGIETVYLSTQDKQSFYEHLGYVPCKPVCMYGKHVSVNKTQQPEQNLKEMIIPTPACTTSAAQPHAHHHHHCSHVPVAPPMPKNKPSLGTKHHWLKKCL